MVEATVELSIAKIFQIFKYCQIPISNTSKLSQQQKSRFKTLLTHF